MLIKTVLHIHIYVLLTIIHIPIIKLKPLQIEKVRAFSFNFVTIESFSLNYKKYWRHVEKK